ncbi:hypothetical protein HFP15_17890 [Amycolatopsis sp. K13G38]|uniref:Nucleotidyltransferase domain-containing protein n=1 Tax=Amycolatopsis acididurans TaxID=2724524 RepID=A0ABX1J4S7_9PSEU|nr:hypothetical protein [Amycolatopsis acididurans]NKQ54758.1 hypothetical protein [Amycolatopsis acididurans]
MDTAHRDALARELRRALTSACPGSRTDLSGSLARGTADVFSDVDLRWTVPDDEFADAVAGLTGVLEQVWPVATVRTQESAQRWRVLASFRDLPLFWQLDLDVRAESCPDDAAVDEPPAASALADGIATVRAVLRGQPATAVSLLDRALINVKSEATATGQWREDIARLAAAAAELDPEAREPADELVTLATEYLH